MRSAILREIHPRDRPQLDAQRLEEDGKDVRHQYNKEEFVFDGCACRDVRRVVS
jgi:hypothetical protein